MIDANTLLNPDFQDAELRAYAFLSTQYKHGVRSPVDCLQPFVIHAIAANKDKQLDWQSIRDFLRTRYSLRIPFYMLERMQSELIHIGALRKTDIPHLYICQDARPALSNKEIDFSISDIEAVGDALTRYATARGASSPLTANSWSDIIIPFFIHRPPPQDKATAKVRNVIISNPKTFDFGVLAEFIMDQYTQRTHIYRSIERIYYGTLVADFLTQIETTGNKASFKGLSVVYDAPVILRLLGCSGRILKEATIELHDTLRDLGCRTWFFHHTYDEISASIEAIIKCHENQQPMFRETQEAIARGETSIAEIYGIRTDLDLRLAGLGLVEHSTGYQNRSSDDFQIDEDEFKAYLQRFRTWGTKGGLAADRDVMSLAIIMRLRQGKQVRDVSKSNFVFVTHNVRLAVLSKDFLREEGQLTDGSVWPMMTVGQLSTIAWVVNEVFQDDRRVSKELIANCYAAALPDDDFDERLKEVLSRTRPESVHDLYNNAFVIQSIRAVALNKTAGHSALVHTLNTAEILAEAERKREEAIGEARANEREHAEKEFFENLEERRRSAAEIISSRISKVILSIVFFLSVFLISKDFGVIGGGATRSKAEAVGLALIAIYSAADGFGTIPAVSVRKGITYLIRLLVTRLQRALI